MKNRTNPPPPLPHLDRDQLRQLVVAEQAGTRLNCLVCGEPVLEQTFTLGPGGDESQRMLINSPCAHAMTYGRQLAEQVTSSLRSQKATEATGPDTSRAEGGPQPLDGNAAADALAAEMHRRAQRLRQLREDPAASPSVRDHVYGEVLGLRGAIGIVLGHQVPGGSADLMGIDYYEAWCYRQGVTV